MFSPGKQFGGFLIENVIYMNKPKTSVVFKSTLTNGEKVAIKCLSIKHFGKQIRNESKVFREFKSNEKIIKCLDSFRHGRYHCFVLKYAENGDLYNYIKKRDIISESSVKNIIYNVLLALNDLHSKGFCHQDIKIDNILLFGDETTAVLADFGSTEKINDGEKSSSILGSPIYLAPEILTSKLHDKSADMWALGVTLFMLLAGEIPFYGKNAKQLLDDIESRTKRQGGISACPELNNSSKEAKDLISAMLQEDPEKRIKASEALKSAWFNSLDEFPSKFVESHEEVESIEVAL